MEVAIGLGSNRSHGRHGLPKEVIRAAIQALEAGGLRVEHVSPILQTAPLGPSKRRYANAALTARWPHGPQALLQLLKKVERDFGRRRGLRWGARVVDCDLLAFGTSRVRQKGLTVPHPRLHQRDFVLQPLEKIWPGWRHPVLHLSVRQMRARLLKPQAVD